MKNLNDEINSFQKVWEGGYKTGYSNKRNQKGLEKYIKENMFGQNLLEIGCGGGQWSKYIYKTNNFNKMFCIDVLSEEHNNFWNYVGDDSKGIIQYEHVKNFNLSFLSDASIDYVFNYDVFCHISYSGLAAYLESLFKKCKSGAKLLFMYADAEKYLNSEPENRYHVIKYLPKKKVIYKLSNRLLINDAIKDMDGMPSSPEFEPRWFWIGKKNFIELCEKKGFSILEDDLDIDKTNPITLFTKL
jgi:SAM-dependent methyltransferase